MAPKTTEALKADYRAMKLYDLDSLEGIIGETVGSPIEEMLLWGLIANNVGAWHTYIVGEPVNLPGGDQNLETVFIEAEDTHEAYSWTYWLQPLVHVGEKNYRLDIAIEVFSKVTKLKVFVAVECDGHEFHEKSKRQAETDKRRDRDLQSIGWTVARFSGAEIFRNPIAAAKSIGKLAGSVMDIRERAHATAVARSKKVDG
jgi:hypothetical protein